ncbi:hypothetical protein MXD81_49265 [Microbacteriaceae bacterium K1510]|nr:hypothetical protein [Microbacteriaceae bacterium K1510]
MPEVLVALVVAALFLGTLARVFGNAWFDSRRPMEQVSALAVARMVAAEAQQSDRAVVTREGRIQLFDYVTTIMPLEPEVRISKLAPRPGGSPNEKPPDNIGTSELQRIVVTVTAPSRRRLTFETIRLVTAKN